jgi:hypothetical protein
MFVPPDAVSIGSMVVEKSDGFVDRRKQSLGSNFTRLKQPASKLSSLVIYGHNGGSLAVGRRGKQPCRSTNIIVWYVIGTLKSW